MSESPTREQLEAIHSTSRDILIKAGAGTGKTSTTIKRYERLIGTDEGGAGLTPDEVLVFTFTDKAATELRNRVRDLRSDAEGPSFSMSTAWIGTFHSVCSRILRANPVPANVDPLFSVLDDVGAARMKDAAYQRALSGFMDSKERELFIARFTPSQLQDGVSNAYDELRSRGHSEPSLPPAEGVDLAGSLTGLRAIAERAKSIDALQAKTLEKIDGLCEFLDSVAPEGVSLDEFEAAAEAFSNASKKLGELNSAVKLTFNAVATSEVGGAFRGYLDALLRGYSDEYSKIKRDAGVLDYEDLQIFTLDLLRSRDAIADSYRERFREIMVDEFQDTNQLQLDLIEALRGPETTLFTVGDEMQAIYGFRHADIQLFRSRRDNPEVQKLKLSANFRSQFPVISAVNLIGGRLYGQNAASPTLEAEGATDAEDAPAEDGVAAGGRHEFTPLRVGLEPKEQAGDEVEVLVTEDKGWTDLDLGPLSPARDSDGPKRSETDDACQAEALLLADHIRHLVDRKDVAPGDVAILFRAKARMWMYVEALRQFGLGAYVVGGSGFWETREGIDIRALLATVANPLDDESLLAPLTGPACGLSSDAIWMLRRDSGYDRPMWPALVAAAGDDPPEDFPEEDRIRARRFVSALTGIREEMAELDLGEVVKRAVADTGYDLVTLSRDGDGAGLANVRRLATLASEFESGEGRDLRGFLDWIETSARIDSEGAVATEDEASDVVRLMTVHKAKGLQFEMVCLPDLGRKRPNMTETVFWLGPDPGDRTSRDLKFGLRVPRPDGGNFDLYDWALLAEDAQREAADEELRLFHVAMTRAKRRLVISGTSNFNPEVSITDHSNTAVRLTKALEIGMDDPESTHVPAAGAMESLKGTIVDSKIAIRRNHADGDRAAELGRTVDAGGAKHGMPVGKPPFHRPKRTRHPDVPLSFTALNELRQCPTRFYAKRVLRLDEPADGHSPLDPQEESPNLVREATSFGTAVHELLEKCATRGWIRPAEAEISAQLELRGFESGDAARLDRASEMIDGFLESPLGAEVAAGRCDVEIPLLVEIDGITVRGFADLLVREASPPLILDYKSNRLDGGPPADKMGEYGLQRDLYGLAVARALEATEVDTAFVFLEAPDEPVRKRLGEAELSEAAQRIGDLIDLIRNGSFFADTKPAAAPCGSCWACSELVRVDWNGP